MNGIPVQPDVTFMAVFKKEEVNPSEKQFSRENLMTDLTDVSEQFVMKYRTLIPGVGSFDVYYVGPVNKEYVADYIVLFQAAMKVRNRWIYGTSLQDLCILGWSMDSRYWVTKLPDGSSHYGWANPLGPFTSYDEAVFWQRISLDLPVKSK